MSDRSAFLLVTGVLLSAPLQARTGMPNAAVSGPAMRAARVDLGRGAVVDVRAMEERLESTEPPRVAVEIRNPGGGLRQRITYDYGYPLMAREGRLCFRDYDHDGYRDLSVLRELAGKFQRFAVWRYDPGSGRLVKDGLTTALDRLPNLRVDPDRRLVVSSSIGPATPYRRAYSIVDGALRLEESCEFRNESGDTYLRGVLITSRRGQPTIRVFHAVADLMDLPCQDQQAAADTAACF